MGILQVAFHTDGDSLRYNWGHSSEFSRAFRDIAQDNENRVVLVTGTGREFVGPRADVPEGQVATMSKKLGGKSGLTASSLAEGLAIVREMQNAILDVPVPTVCAVNGPVLRHCELALWADVIVASDDASFEDSVHFDLQGLVPGDGMQIIATMLMGINRARSFLLTGEVIDAQEALRLGMVAELAAKDQVLARALEIARKIAEKPDITLRHTRAILTMPIKKMVLEYATVGLQLEATAMLARYT
jgi:enoyl-CoA hydratase/carnithine racemase